jgi:hypothetical protein
MIPIPFIFYRWGDKIRARSKFALTLSSSSSETLEELEDGEEKV